MICSLGGKAAIKKTLKRTGKNADYHDFHLICALHFFFENTPTSAQKILF